MELINGNPFTPIVFACALSAAAFGIAAFAAKSAFIGSIAPPTIFLIAYYMTYQKIPGFPPVAASNKVFYVVPIATIGAFVLEKVPSALSPRAVAAGAVSLLATVWIGYARLNAPDLELLATGGALVLVGALVLWRMDAIAIGSGPPGGGAPALALLAALAAAVAPVALFGGSSTSVGLCLGLSVGVAIVSLAEFWIPGTLGALAILGAGGGLLAIVNTIALINRRADLLALGLCALVPFVGPSGVRLLPATMRDQRALVWIATGLAALSPLPVIVALLFLRHENPLGN